MANHGVVVCVDSERLPIRESDVAGLAAAKVIIDGAQQTLATNPSSMYGSCPFGHQHCSRDSLFVRCAGCGC